MKVGNPPYRLILRVALLAIFFASLFFNWRAITSATLLALEITVLFPGQRCRHIYRHYKSETLLFVACLLLLLWEMLSLLLQRQTLQPLRIQLAIVLVPLAAVFWRPESEMEKTWMMRAYLVSLTIASACCLFAAALHFMEGYPNSIFFYHDLVSPLRQHAVYFSIYVITGLLMMWSNTSLFHQTARSALIAFFSCFIWLLSSKIVILFYLAYLFVRFIHSATKRSSVNLRMWSIGGIGVFVIILLMATKNPVSTRFRDIFHSQVSVLSQDRYHPGDYFNGLQFRLLQWKLVPTVLDRQRAWLYGTGGRSQELLNDAYAEKNMYLGDPATGSIGYRAYNTHNQFLETLLKYGLPGLVFFTMIYGMLFLMAANAPTLESRLLFCLLLVYALVEAVLETQYGLMLFLFLPLWLAQKPTRDPAFAIE